MMVIDRTIVKDYGWKRIVRDMVKLHNTEVKIGLPEEGKTSGRYSMDKLAQVAFTNEYGFREGQPGGIPRRPFMAQSFDKNQSKIEDTVFVTVRLITDGKLTVLRGLKTIGSEVVSCISEELLGQDFKELAEYTIAKKGHSVIFFETGQLRDSIQYKVNVRSVAHE